MNARPRFDTSSQACLPFLFVAHEAACSSIGGATTLFRSYP